MKKVISLEEWSVSGLSFKAPGSYALDQEKEKGDFFRIGKPVTALEALMDAGKIESSILEDGEAEYCEWVAEKSWLYTCSFPKPAGDKCFLYFEGLDTDCDIWLNGKKLAEHHTMYLPLRVEISDFLMPENELAVYFYSPVELMKYRADRMPDSWKGIVSPAALLRKPPCDLYRNYLGVTPYFTPVGFFGDVLLEIPDKAEIGQFSVDYRLNPSLTEADISFRTDVRCDIPENIDLIFSLYSPDGEKIVEKIRPLSGDGGTEDSVSDSFQLSDPQLWWPVGYGDHPLYRAECVLCCNGEILDRCEKQIGFRKVEVVGSLKFRINGTVIRLWGANLATMGNVSHRPDVERGRFLLERAAACRCNTLRVWGPGEPVCDDFYEQADRMGILIWQDFFIEPSQLPDSPDYRSLFLQEAEHLILRLRHHPCLLLWCGSNESLHMLDFNHEDARIEAETLLTHDFPLLCAKLDPDRYYHISCPSGGLFPNDPSFGDTHGSHCMMSYQPGEEFAVFFSEHIVTFPPELKSLKRFIPEKEIWPEGFSDLASFGKKSCFPPTLERRTNNFSQDKLGPVERFYDAVDASSLIYKYTAAAGYAYYHQIARLRRGKPSYDAAGSRRSNGYLSWKFNNTWPQFYCGLVDYYGECHIPYYETRRAFAPILLDFEVSDHIYLWGVNDTPEDICGTLEIKLFRISENRVIGEFSCPAVILAGESCILTNLDRFGHFRKDCVLYARLVRDGREIARTNEFVNLERNLAFPPAQISMELRGDSLILTTDSFARCVEMSGETPDGDEFGWLFEDNYFDLLPFERKEIKILGKHPAGIVQAKPHYSPNTCKVDWAHIPE